MKTVSSDRRFLVSGALLLAVAMGVGRFVYTPLLPVMERDAGLTVGDAGTLASSNLFGYLIGAGLAMAPFTHRRRLLIVRWAIVAVVVPTALMAAESTFWLLLRFVTGIGSALVLVFASSIVLERAAHRNQRSWPPLVFSGIGVGMAFSGIAVPVFVRMAGSRAAWIARLGKARSLALALGIQAVGIVAPILGGGVFSVVIAAVTLGGTFMAITLFATGLAREIFSLRTSAAISRLTVLYGLGQMIGPLIATQLALRTGSYDSALLTAGTIAGIAAVTTLITVREPHFEEIAHF